MPNSNIERLKEIELAPDEEEVVSFLSKLKKKTLLWGG
jgi:hypothetical protein